jgi:hypothetical protein
MNTDPKILLYVIMESAGNERRTRSNFVFQGLIGLLYPRISHLQVLGCWEAIVASQEGAGRGGGGGGSSCIVISVRIPHTNSIK